MIYNNNIIKAEFIKRPNRFIAHVKLNHEEVIVHVPNTGRCKEILTHGTTVVLAQAKMLNRKTQYDLIAAYKGRKLINIDSQASNKVVYEALNKGKIEELKSYTTIEREKKFGNSRFDFKLSNDKEEYYLEVKGGTFEKDGHCMFPDAPTDRGRKHILELIDLKSKGGKGGILFLVQLQEVNSFSPYDTIDKKFGEALRAAYKKGVDVFAYNCIVKEDCIELDKKIDILL